MDLKNTVNIILKSLVSKEDQIQINENHNSSSFVFEVRVAQEDMGKLIGKKGRTIEALRTILEALSLKQNKRCIFLLLEDKQ